MAEKQLERDVAFMWASLKEKLWANVVLWNKVYLIYSDESGNYQVYIIQRNYQI